MSSNIAGLGKAAAAYERVHGEANATQFVKLIKKFLGHSLDAYSQTGNKKHTPTFGVSAPRSAINAADVATCKACAKDSRKKCGCDTWFSQPKPKQGEERKICAECSTIPTTKLCNRHNLEA